MSLPELEVKCWQCWGEGVLAAEDHADVVECPECGGIGWIPTADGARLLQFVQKHLSVDFGEEDE